MKYLYTPLISIWLILLPAVGFASELFPYTVKGNIPEVTHKEQHYSMSFTITSVLPTAEPFSVTFTPHNTDFSLINGCKAVVLDGGKSCTITVNLGAQRMGATSANLMVNLANFPVLDQTLSTTVNDTLGHFVYKSSDGKTVLNSLNLKDGDSETVYLENSGGTTISNFQLIIDEGIKEYFSGECIGATLLKGRSRCALTYKIPKTVVASSGVLHVSGEKVDNTPSQLAVTVSALGHFVFKSGDGKTSLNSLNLKGSDTGSIRLENSGSMTIDNLQLTLPDGVKAYFKGDCLESTRSLAVGTYCTLHYTLPKVVTAASGDLQARGNNVDNTPSDLPVTVSALGHFVYKSDDGKTSLSSLDLKGGDTGTVLLENSGGMAINQLNVTAPEAIKAYFPSGSCFEDIALRVGASCSLNYVVPQQLATVASGTLQASGNDVDNTALALKVDINPIPLTVVSTAIDKTCFNAGSSGTVTVTLIFNRPVMDGEFKLYEAWYFYDSVEGRISMTPTLDASVKEISGDKIYIANQFHSTYSRAPSAYIREDFHIDGQWNSAFSPSFENSAWC